MERHRLAIVVPAFNEGGTIAGVIESASLHGMVVVVDDGSSDDTSKRAIEAGAVVVPFRVNLGYDEALNAGFRKAVELDCSHVITMDADGQHDAGIIDRFVAALDTGAAIVVGKRDRKQRFTERLFAAWTKAKWRIEDPLCGMKGYCLRIYLDLGHFDTFGSIGTELLLFAARRGESIVQIPVRTFDRSDAPRFGRVFSGNLRIARALVMSAVPALRRSATRAK
jgi:glycosyltransferase involved in cell wall biosynthesis